MRIQVEPLKRLTAAVFTKAGCSDTEATHIAKHLVEANLTGHDSHGVIRIPRYVQWMGDGTLVPGQTIEIMTENATMAVVDGRHGFGQSIGTQAVELGIEKAKADGVSVIALRNSGHLGRIGDWAEMAVEAELASIHFVNVAGSLLVAPFGGTQRRMSTNPFAIGIPFEDRPPLVLDFATSVVAEGKVLVAASGGKPLPPGSLIEADGTLSSDPKALYGAGDLHDPQGGRKGTGAIRCMGEHKGSGLALMCEMLAGALTGSGCAGPKERRIANGMLSIYLAIEAFDAGDLFAAEAKQYLDFFTGSKPASPGGEVLVPGQPEQRNRARRRAEGVELSDDAWSEILETARKIGLGQGEIDGLLAG